MSKLSAAEDFKSMPLPEKFDFLESKLYDLISSLNEQDLYTFLKEIILDETLNTNIRKRMLALFTDCVILKKIRLRHGLNLLIDDWKGDPDVHLEIQRLKDLYYYFNEEREQIEKIYTGCLKDEEGEIISESAFNLGLISIQNSFESKTREEITQHLKISESYFIQASGIIENRIDASFFRSVVRILIDILDNLWGNVQNNIKIIANLFYQKEAFSFNFTTNPFYLGFYRILNSVYVTTQENPDNWLDIRQGFRHLYVQYAEINNQQLKERLNHSIVAASFVDLVNNEFIEPYYAINHSSQIARIDLRLSELNSGTEEYNFLTYIKTLTGQDIKKN